MDDQEIIALLMRQDERALAEIRRQYGKQLGAVAARHLQSPEDIEEVLSDVLLAVWQNPPQADSERLFSYLSAITQRTAINRWEQAHAAKRGGHMQPTPLDELSECLPAGECVEQEIERAALTAALNRFLAGLKPEARVMTVQRYVRQKSIREIAEAYGISESKVKVTLMRTRRKLKVFLEKEEWI